MLVTGMCIYNDIVIVPGLRWVGAKLGMTSGSTGGNDPYSNLDEGRGATAGGGGGSGDAPAARAGGGGRRRRRREAAVDSEEDDDEARILDNEHLPAGTGEGESVAYKPE